jgi:DNA end-binding protein Ku
MAPRPNWKGFLRLSLVTCPVALYPATSESEKISFNQINRNTGHRIKYLKVDAETGDEVESADIIKGYKVDTDTYLQVTQEEIDAILPESSRTIEIDQFVPKSEIDELYLVRPYYIVPDGKVGQDAYAVIRETIRTMDRVALARVVLTNREHIIALQARGKGLTGMLLRYPYEVRDAADYFDEIQDVKVTKDMLDLAKHIVESKAGHFQPDLFEDEYETAVTELINRKRAGQPIARAKPRDQGNVIDLMEALRRSLGQDAPKRAKEAVKEAQPVAKETAKIAKAKKPRKRVAGQTEMLLPIAGKGAGKKPAQAKDTKEPAKKPVARTTGTKRKAG